MESNLLMPLGWRPPACIRYCAKNALVVDLDIPMRASALKQSQNCSSPIITSLLPLL